MLPFILIEFDDEILLIFSKSAGILSVFVSIFPKLVDTSFLFVSIFDEFDKIVFSRSPKLLFTDIRFIFYNV